jgi:hypothetical protein
VIAGELQCKSRADYRQGIVHEQRRGETAPDQQSEYQRVGRTDPVECGIGRRVQGAAFHQCFTQHEHSEQEHHDVRFDGA